MRSLCSLILLWLVCIVSCAAVYDQRPLNGPPPDDRSRIQPWSDVRDPHCPPRGEYSTGSSVIADLEEDKGDAWLSAVERMELYPLHISGKKDERVNLMFFSDGYTAEEEPKFVKDAQRLSDDIVSSSGPMSHVADLLNVWAAFVPSDLSGIGTHDIPLRGAAFGLYRPGAELRAVFVDQPKKARKACRHFREGKSEGGCDQAILLGNDPLYGGLGGEFTIVTASNLNGPLVLLHELGHSLIPVGEEYEGGYAYFGANSDKDDHLDRLQWKDHLTDPENLKVEDAKVPVQVYPWHDLDQAPYSVSFNSSNNPLLIEEKAYPSALLRASISSIPYASHISIRLNGRPLGLFEGFPADWAGSQDRRWLEVPLPSGLDSGRNQIDVTLTQLGREAEAGQGGKMITSLEIIEYGPTFNHTEGHIGAFPTYAMDASVTLRPTNEACLMRRVNHPHFCPICAQALRRSLEGRISGRRELTGL